MASYTTLLSVYVLGGVTFIPLLLLAVLIHAYLFFPTRSSDDSSSATPNPEDDVHDRPGNEEDILKAGTGGLLEKFNLRNHETDVAAGYFAVCREYVPGGVNGKPPERITPAGSVIASESPSVYQSMYRSLFDRRQAPTLEPGKPGKKASNVFFVVLRLGHLMLYLDSEQVTLRHVFSLAHYDVGLYDGSNELIPEGELWIKRNAISLTRKAHLRDSNPDGSASHQLFLFSENCSEKEDFYFALLQNQDQKADVPNHAPRVLHYDVKHIVSLVQRLHSSEEQLQTRWINALIGRLFLSIYKSADMEQFVRNKVNKKIARVKKPAFLSDIFLQKIDMGEGPPYITNPRLKDLTVDGHCAVEADVRYSGNFRLEIATTARIELGARFKVREVNLVLAVVFKKLEGHGIIRFKPPPSNRMWITFETMPKIEMSIEPIVSSRQITYGVILRQIENRIREVIAETVVAPHWDDIPFTETLNQAFRGGIWADSEPQHRSAEPESEAVDDADLGHAAEEVKSMDTSLKDDEPDLDSLRSREKTMSMPALAPFPSLSKKSRKAGLSTQSLVDNNEATASSTSVETKKRPAKPKATASSTSIETTKRPEKPKAVRAGSFAAASAPLVSMDATNVDAMKSQTDTSRKDAASAMIEISHRSLPDSPDESPVGSPSQPSVFAETAESNSSTSSKGSYGSDDSTPEVQTETPGRTPQPSSPASTGGGSAKSLHAFARDSSRSASTTSFGKSMAMSADKKQSLANLGSAAKKWSWGVMNKNHERQSSLDANGEIPKEGTKENPIGRGQPIPFASEKLASSEKSKIESISSRGSRRKAVPPPVIPPRALEVKPRQVSTPPLPARRRPHATETEKGDDGLLVVSAPSDSGPSTPVTDGKEDFVHSLDMDDDDSVPETANGKRASAETKEMDVEDGSHTEIPAQEKEDHPNNNDTPKNLDPSPASRPVSRAEPEEVGKDVLPSYIAGEAEAESTKLWMDSENGHLS
ncbi:MAG: hypothetical protein M1837_003138 [Sclerophora amabilis]|nr:MAG: hypothetical protein M1837_003138 [Sclerophora amabilis]